MVSLSSWHGPAIKVKGLSFPITKLLHFTLWFSFIELVLTALTNDENSGCGVKGLDLNSG